jgi:UDP-GlcNAc:undecaprenyl-phosphate GlcNAc-1-phosphate transferase
MLLVGSGILLCSFVVAIILTAVARRVAVRLEFVDVPDARKVHTQPMPLGGGLAILVAATMPPLIGCLAAVIFREGFPSLAPEILHDNLGLLLSKWPTVLVIVAGGAVISFLGLIDDLRGLTPWSRLVIESLVALILFLWTPDVRITVFLNSSLLSAVYTTVWIVGLINAFNFLDHMDGLCSGTTAVACLIFLPVAYVTGQLFIAALILSLLGAVLGFLVFNFPPARIFMGDAGSTFIGYTMGVLTAAFTFYEKDTSAHWLLSLALPVLILSVPIFDTVAVVYLRVRDGRPIFKSDRNHFSHRLVELGMTQRQAVLTIYLATFVIGAGAMFWYQLNVVGELIVFGQAVAVFGIIFLLESAARRRNKEKA